MAETNLTWTDVLDELRKENKVRKTHWPDKKYIYTNKDCNIIYGSDGLHYQIIAADVLNNYDDWEVYDEATSLSECLVTTREEGEVILKEDLIEFGQKIMDKKSIIFMDGKSDLNVNCCSCCRKWRDELDQFFEEFKSELGEELV